MAYDFQLKYTLHAQSPLIHFQYDTYGATLRATEVKPKLDRFLLRRARKAGIDFKKWVNKKHETALDYKMEITAIEANEPFAVGTRDSYDIYYGNMGDENSNMAMGIENKAEMTVTCINGELRKFIDDNIDMFFIVTNFGRMSSKGFGSFIVDRKPLLRKPEKVSEILRDEYGCECCYRFDFDGPVPDIKGLFKCIKTVYALMKSGSNLWLKDKNTGRFYPTDSYHRSLLFLYMHEEEDLGNEKAWLKQQRIAPAIGRQHEQYDEENYYVRALFGVGDKIEFLNDLQDRSRQNKTKVTISSVSKNIERFPSPILFKVIGSEVYIVGRRIDDKIYGEKFRFSSQMGSGILSVPKKEDLREDFMDDFMDYCKCVLNKEALGLFRDTKYLYIEEV